MVSFHTDTGLKPLSPLIDGPVNDCLPKVWPYTNQMLFQLVGVACALLINITTVYTDFHTLPSPDLHLHQILVLVHVFPPHIYKLAIAFANYFNLNKQIK